MTYGRKYFITIGAALVLLAALMAPPQAAAQSEATNVARLDGHVCEQLPSSPRIDVQISDDAPRFLRLRDRFIARMKKDAIEIAAGAPLVLFLDVQTVREIQEQRKGSMGQVNIGKGGGVSVRSNIWSNTDDSLIGGRKKTANRLSSDRLRITAALNGRDDGRCIWQGRLVHDLRGGDPDRAAERFLPVLAGAIGQSVQARQVEATP
jgi:hypothetical protein